MVNIFYLNEATQLLVLHNKAIENNSSETFKFSCSVIQKRGYSQEEKGPKITFSPAPIPQKRPHLRV